MDAATQILNNIKLHIFNPIASLIVAAAFFYFIWGCYDFVAGKDNKDQLDRGKKHFVWGLLGLTITVSAFGILNFISSAINSIGK